jgi:hypothetical protein
MYGARLLGRVHLADVHRERNGSRHSWQGPGSVAGLTVRHWLERASGMGAWAVSLGQLRDEHPDTPGRGRVSGPL